MIISIQQNKFVIVSGRNALLYTVSDKREIAIRRYENEEKKRFVETSLLKCANVNISIRDLNTED